MRGINMSKSELWKKFLENMKELTSSTSFGTQADAPVIFILPIDKKLIISFVVQY